MISERLLPPPSPSVRHSLPPDRVLRRQNERRLHAQARILAREAPHTQAHSRVSPARASTRTPALIRTLPYAYAQERRNSPGVVRARSGCRACSARVPAFRASARLHGQAQPRVRVQARQNARTRMRMRAALRMLRRKMSERSLMLHRDDKPRHRASLMPAPKAGLRGEVSAHCDQPRQVRVTSLVMLRRDGKPRATRSERSLAPRPASRRAGTSPASVFPCGSGMGWGADTGAST